MAVPGAALHEITRGGLRDARFTDTAHFRLYRAFTADPEGFVTSAVEGDERMLF